MRTDVTPATALFRRRSREARPNVARRRNVPRPSTAAMINFNTVLAMIPTMMARAASRGTIAASTRLSETINASTSVEPSIAPLATKPTLLWNCRTHATSSMAA